MLEGHGQHSGVGSTVLQSLWLLHFQGTYFVVAM